MAYSAITIGSDANDRSNTQTYGYTVIATHDGTSNQANASGVLTSFEIYFATQGSNVKIGTFSRSSDNFDDRDYESIGTVSSGSKQTLTGRNCDVQTDDYIGCYYSAGTLESSNSNGRAYRASGDKFGSGAAAYSSTTGYLSLYGTGVTVPDAPTGVSATDNTHTDKVVITWTAGTGETGGHRVYRGGSDISGVVAHGTNTFDDTTGTPGTTYAYTVKAINDAGLSAASTADNGTRSAATTSFIQQIMQHFFIPAFILNYEGV